VMMLLGHARSLGPNHEQVKQEYPDNCCFSHCLSIRLLKVGFVACWSSFHLTIATRCIQRIPVEDTGPAT
jgi:hypothetical protein